MSATRQPGSTFKRLLDSHVPPVRANTHTNCLKWTKRRLVNPGGNLSMPTKSQRSTESHEKSSLMTSGFDTIPKGQAALCFAAQFN